jgi:hypothetical protein
VADQFNQDDYIGLAYAEAHALASGKGWDPRRVSPGDVITLEYQADRLNLLVCEDDVVVEASVG